jgi:hypothetical protein
MYWESQTHEAIPKEEGEGEEEEDPILLSCRHLLLPLGNDCSTSPFFTIRSPQLLGRPQRDGRLHVGLSTCSLGQFVGQNHAEAALGTEMLADGTSHFAS